MTAVIEVSDLHKRYRARDPWAVQGVSFTVEPGQAFGLLGPNGAGKSTVVKTIVGLTRPDSGTVSVFGWPQTAEALTRSSYRRAQRWRQTSCC